MFTKTPEEPGLRFGDKLKMFMAAHWRGVIIVLLPIILLIIVVPFPGLKFQWCAHTLLLMAVFWITEVLPLPLTAILPVFTFPLVGIFDSNDVSKCYVNDAVVMFLGSLMLAASIEQSGYHKRLAFFFIRVIGYSHIRLLLAICTVTTLISLWITNTATTVMMVPIVFALLKVFEEQKIVQMFEKDVQGNKVASDVTSTYFCAVAISATTGGIGTLISTDTNLVFKNFMMTEYPDAPEYLSFPLFSAFAFPYMCILQALAYLYLAISYFGLFRPNSKTYTSTKITPRDQAAAQDSIMAETKKLGALSYWEYNVVILFSATIGLFFSRSPQIFVGWGDKIAMFYGEKNMKFVKDSALAISAPWVMLWLPHSLEFFKNFTAKYHEELPQKPVTSILNWPLLNKTLGYSFMFLLGGGAALSKGCKISGLNNKIGEFMVIMKSLPPSIILLFVICSVMFVTNFGSNVAVCNVFTPIAMTLATIVGVNPFWYNIASGYCASFAFMTAVGTPPNLIVKVVASVPPGKMAKAGLGPTISSAIVTWFAMSYWAPVIWPDLQKPDIYWNYNYKRGPGS